MGNIDNFMTKGLQFESVDYVVEIFPSPIPTEINGEEIQNVYDLFRASSILGLNELYIPESEEIEAVCEDETLSFTREEFIKWQLERFSSETIYYLINKTSMQVEELLDDDLEYEKDDNYNPSSWVSEYEQEYFEDGIKFINRLRAEVPEKFYQRLTEAILDEDYGLTSWLETDITDDITLARKYDHWDVKLMVVSKGRFLPYIDPEYHSNLAMDEYNLHEMYIRNCDEGDID